MTKGFGLKEYKTNKEIDKAIRKSRNYALITELFGLSVFGFGMFSSKIDFMLIGVVTINLSLYYHIEAILFSLAMEKKK